MLRYFLKRVLLFIPTLWVISLLIFFLSKGSETELIQNKLERTTRIENYDRLQEWNKIRATRQQMGLNKPKFYWSLHRNSTSDTLHRIEDLEVRKQLNSLAYQIGNWEKTNQFWKEVKKKIITSPFEEREVIINFLRSNLSNSIPSKNKQVLVLQEMLLELRESPAPLNNYTLHFTWNGWDNQYHQWITNLFSGNFGYSSVDGTSVNTKLFKALKWTLLLSGISLIITFLVAIPLAFHVALHPKSLISYFLDKLFFTFYAIPNFWMATLLIVFLASGDFLSWFPAYGLGNPEEASNWFDLLYIRVSHLFLPVVTLTYGSIAFIYQQLKVSIQNHLQQDYVLTAKAKGLPMKNIKWKQLFKNVSFPLVTILGNLLPALLSGSFIVEFIFSIPGMGKISVEAFLSRDFNMVYTILLLSSFLGMLGILFSDLLYHKLDPRVQLHASKIKEL